MDTSRDADLKHLKELFDNPLKPMHIRKAAYKSFNNILRQLKDKKLADMRLELIRATRAEDIRAVEMIEKRLTEYSWRKGYNQPPTA